MTATLATTPPVERQVALDMIRRALPFVPVLLLVAGLVWGVDGAVSAGYGVVLVLLNLLLSALLLGWAARISLTLLMATALFGYLARLAMVTAAVLLVKDAGWVDIVPLGLTIIVTHLGLLFWETRYVSASLAFPGLKPSAGGTGGVAAEPAPTVVPPTSGREAAARPVEEGVR